MAQDRNWSYDASIYAWFPDTNVSLGTPLGTVDGELSISDALQNLDFAFMGTVEARNGRWGVIGDFVYFNISPDAPTPRGLAFSNVVVDTKLTMLSAYGMYRVHGDATTSVDLGFGARAYWSDITTTFVGNKAASRVFDTSDNWVDPLLAARVRAQFSEKWYGALFLDAGGFGVGSDSTYQVVATVGYNINAKWAVQGGYRYLDVDKQEGDLADLNIQLSGPVIGAVYRF
jgi:opacity protein-like surface antigen